MMSASAEKNVPGFLQPPRVSVETVVCLSATPVLIATRFPCDNCTRLVLRGRNLRKGRDLRRAGNRWDVKIP